MAEQKRYVVWIGAKTGIFDNRNAVQPLVSGFKGAKYKSFKSASEAEIALQTGREPYYQAEKKRNEKDLPFIKKSIAVDAACSSATGILEYQGIDLESEQRIFHQKLPSGTNNIGEFLAIVHGLAYLQQEKKADFIIYSDSKIAMNRVAQGKCKTSFAFEKDPQLASFIQRAETRLATNHYTTQLLKWKTSERGEIPADFGRK